MKGFIACTLALAPFFASQNLKNQFTFHSPMMKKLHVRERR